MKAKLLLKFVVLAVSLIFSEPKNKYCELESCPNATHVMCQYPNHGASESCPIVEDRSLIFDEKVAIVQIFDEKLKWDEELAILAQRWADQCNYGMDNCRNVARFDVRQRAYVIPRKDKYKVQKSYSTKLYKSDLLYYSLLNEWKEEDAETWKNENRIGCGKTSASNGTLHLLIFVCNFGNETYKWMTKRN